MLNISNEMQRFLITTTFGYDLNADDPGYIQLKKACSRRAYLDLARVVPYKYSVSKIDECIKKREKEREIENFENAKSNFIKTIEEKLIQSNEAKCSREIISEVYSDAAKFGMNVFKSSFTYGMSQKWVNMYFKYLWLFSDADELVGDFGISTDLDMPIDSYIIDALFTKGVLSEEICNNPNNRYLNELISTRDKKIRINTRPSESVLKWSGWDREIYTAVQELIKERCKAENIHILQYENQLWMKQVMGENH